jgi:hypothetical protein
VDHIWLKMCEKESYGNNTLGKIKEGVTFCDVRVSHGISLMLGINTGQCWI